MTPDKLHQSKQSEPREAHASGAAIDTDDPATMTTLNQHTPGRADSPRRADAVQSVERAFRLLSVLVEHDQPMSALDLARSTGLNRTVVYRLLRTLNSLGLATEHRGRYGLGNQLAGLGYAYIERLPFRRAALMYVIDLHVSIVDKPWVTSLSIPIDDQVVLIDRLWGKHTPLNSILDVGTRLDLDHSAAGRSMLAYLDPDRAAELIGRERLDAVADQLAQARADGFVVSKDEVGPGIVAVASAVRDSAGRPCGAVSVAGTADGELGSTPELNQQIRRVAMNIERTLTP